MSGRLGKANLVANTDTTLYTVPANKVATVNLNICNRNATQRIIRVAIHQGALGDADYLEYGALVPAGGVLERTGLTMSAGEIMTVRANASGVSVRVYGFEENV